MYDEIYEFNVKMRNFTALKCKETRNIDTCIEEYLGYRKEMRERLYEIYDCIDESCCAGYPMMEERCVSGCFSDLKKLKEIEEKAREKVK